MCRIYRLDICVSTGLGCPLGLYKNNIATRPVGPQTAITFSYNPKGLHFKEKITVLILGVLYE
jgi:hypothetical protein